MLIFNSIKISNFMSLEELTLDLTNLGLVLVNGKNQYDELFESNGSGKSSIFESIIWVLTGSTSRGITNVTNRYTNDNCNVILDLNFNDNNFLITRTCNKKAQKALSIKKNNKDISGATASKSNEILKNELNGLTYDLLTSLIILPQGLSNKFSSLSPKDRKSKLEELSSTENIISELSLKMDNVISEVKENISKIDNDINLVNIKKAKLDGEQLAYDRQVQVASESLLSKNEIVNYKSEIERVKKEKDQLFTKSNEQNDLIAKKSLLENKMYNKEKLVSKTREELLSLSKKECPLCHSKLTDEGLFNKISEDFKILKKELKELTEEFNKTSSNPKIDYISQISELSSQISKLESLLEQNDTKVKKLEDMKSIDIGNVRIELEKIINNITDLNEKRDIEFNDLNIANYFKKLISTKIRTFLLIEIVEYINTRTDYYSKYLFSDVVVYLKLDGNDIDIFLNEQHYEELSGGEQRRVDIIIQLALRDLAILQINFDSNLFVMDEVLDFLDNNGVSNILDLIKNGLFNIDSLMIVSHKDNLDFEYNRKITIIKNKDRISRVM
jgi:ATPase involved in DNA repair